MLRMSVEMSGPVGFRVLLSHEEELDAIREAEHIERMKAFKTGTLEEFNALTPQRRDQLWEEFHELCAKGMADEMYFYRVLMDQHLQGYAGH